MNRIKLDSKQIKQIRNMVKSGKVKYTIALEMGITPQVVYYHTKDLPSSRLGNSDIRGKTIELLKELLENGYIDSKKNYSSNLRTLRRHFPVIQKVRVNNQSIYFLDDKNKIALNAMIKKQRSKVISYHDLARMTKAFKVNLNYAEKRQMRGKKEHILPIIRKKNGGYMSSYKKTQTNLFDFIGNTEFFGNLNKKKIRKKQSFDNESLLKNDDSLVEFNIPIY